MFFKMAWRNIWRNPRRTMVILTAVIIGVWSMIFLGALMRGIADQMVRNGIATLTGHVQVHREGYRDDPVIEKSMADHGVVEAALEKNLPEGSAWASRVRVSAIASNARHASGITLVGIDPEAEGKVSFIREAVTLGRYLQKDDRNGILVGKALVKKFETKGGRKLVLMSQNTDREIASRAFRIVGIFEAEMESTEKAFVFVLKGSAQEMLGLGNRISEISITLPDYQEAAEVARALKGGLSGKGYEVHSWKELMPLITGILKMYDGFIFWWFLVVFIAMAFGIVNTTLMAVFERIREFGLQKALGMKPLWIVKEVLTESTLLLLMGMTIGNGIGFLSIYALSKMGIDLSALSKGLEFAGMTRIIYPVIYAKDLVTANLVVFVLGLVVSVYPALKAARISPVDAMAYT